MKIIGLDGCQNGWIQAIISNEQAEPMLTIQKIGSANSLAESKFTLCFVDIPIGLSCPKITRTLDSELRKCISPKKKSAVFTAPCREAVFAPNYSEAKKINLAVTGKSISIQAWNICPKISEMEQFILSNPTLNIFEAHPELCFEKLNDNKPLLHSKKTSEGKSERYNIIISIFPNFSAILKAFIEQHKPLTDDILDAVCLATMGYLGAHTGFTPILLTSVYDSKKILMNAYYFERR